MINSKSNPNFLENYGETDVAHTQILVMERHTSARRRFFSNLTLMCLWAREESSNAMIPLIEYFEDRPILR